MKTVLVLVLLLLASCSPMAAREVTFEWDPNPEPDVTRYRVYLHSLLDDSWNVVGEVADDPATPANDTPTRVKVLEFPNVVSRVRATAINSAGLESLPSEEYIVEPEPPGAPKGLRRVVSLQTSTDGKRWETILDYYLPEEPRIFARLEFREAD